MPIASAFRSALRLVGVALIASLPLATRAASTSAADGFNPSVQGTSNGLGPNVYAVAVQPDGRVLLAGAFESLKPNGGTDAPAHHNIARVLPDGTNDSTFTSDVDGQINALLLQPDGKIVIGGKFTTVEGKARKNVARLNSNGTIDLAFDPNPSGSNTGAPVDTAEITSLALQADGKILIAGGFGAVKPNGATSAITRRGVARFNADGSFDASFADIGADGAVLAVAVQPSDNSVIIGGGFTHVINSGGTSTLRNHIARFDATGKLDTTFDPNANANVNAIVVQVDGRIVIGGAFITLTPNGTDTAESTHPRLARLEKTGLSDASFAPVPDGPVSTLKLQADGRILVGGSFSSSASNFGAYAARLLPNGETDLTFYPQPNYQVYAFDVQSDGSVILGGGFSTLAGVGAASIPRSKVARVSSTAGLDTDFRPDVNGRLQTIAVDASGRALVSGTFTSLGGATHSSLVRIKTDGTVDATFKADTNAVVTTILPLADGRILIGGNFTAVNNTSRKYIARLQSDGSLDMSFSADPNAYVASILVQGDKYIIGGAFTALSPGGTTEPIARASIARLNSDGSVDLAFSAQVYSSITTMLMQSDGKFLIAGSFTTVIPTGSTVQVSHYHIARLNADGTLDTTFDARIDGTVYGGTIQSDGQIVLVGIFSQYGINSTTAAVTRNNILRLKSDGTLDASFTPSPNDLVSTILPISGGGFLIGGFFNTIQQPGAGDWVSRNYFARLTSEGKVDSLDLGFDVLPGNSVRSIAQSATSGKVIVGGAFTTLFSQSATPISRNRLVLVSTDGAVDTSYNPELSSGQGATIKALTQQADGSIIVGGSFSGFNGATSSNIALFNSDGVPSTAFYPNVDGTAGQVNSVAQIPAKGETVATQRSGFAWLENNGLLRSGIVKGSDPSQFAGVRAVAVQPHDGKVLVAATATRPPNTDNPSGVPDYLVRFNADGSLDAAFEPLVNSTVLVIKVQPDHKILIGGSFQTVGTSSSSARNYMARLNEDGTIDTAFNPNFGGGIAAIELQSDGKIIVGGTYTTLAPNGQTTSTLRSNITRLNADGSVDTAFNPTADSTVRAIKVLPDGRVLIGGLFTTLQPGATGTAVSRKYLAVLNADGTLGTQDFAINGVVTRIVAQSDNKLLLAGTFTTILGQTRNYIARLNADLTLDTGFNPNPTDIVISVDVQSDGKILIGGDFTAIQPGSTTYDTSLATPRRYGARLNSDGTLDASFNPTFDAEVTDLLAYPGGSVVAGGSFTSVQPAGSVLVGGTFATVSGVKVNNLALFSGDGSVSSTFLPNPNGTVYATQVLADGRYVIAGAFTSVADAAGNRVTRNRLVRFSSSNVLDTTFNPNADDEVHALALQADGKLLIGGKFKNVGGVGHSYLARVDAAGSVDSSFNPSVTGDVTGILVQADQRILVLSAGSGVRNIVSRLNADGSADSTFPATNAGSAPINAIALQTDGKIVIGGGFNADAPVSAPLSTSGAGAKKYLARLNADGTLDLTLTATPSGAVTAIMISPDGKIMIGGAFNAVDGLPRFGLARLAPQTVPSSSFAANPERSTITWKRSGPGPELSAVKFQESADGSTWSDTVGTVTRVVGTPNWTISGLSLAANSLYFVRVFGITTGSAYGSSGVIEARGQIYLSSLPVIQSATAVSATNGQAFTYAITATGSPTEYTATGLPAGLSLSGNVISGTPTQNGTFSITLTVKNSAGSTSTVLTLIVAASGGSGDTSGRLANLSVLSRVDSSNPIISGFVLSGTGSQTVLIRAVGPALTKVGVSDVLASPHLKLYKSTSSGPISEVDGWDGSASVTNAAVRLGALPSLTAGSADVAFLATLSAGAYSFHVSDNGTAGGYALAEIYDASAAPSASAPRLVNISARGVTSGTTMVIGGFVITGNTAKQVLVRGLGPGLGLQGVTGVLTDPKLQLVRNIGGTNTLIASNDNWGNPVTLDAAYPGATASAISAAASAIGASAITSGSTDAAVLVTLPPGVYSAQVSGVGTATGAAMVEVYEVQ